MKNFLIKLLLLLIIILISLKMCNKEQEPFIENLNVYKNCKKMIREKRRNIDKYSKNKIDDIRYKIRRFIRQSGL